MIVSCPACETHYHHAHQGAHQTGRCSQCDETFPLEGAHRRYLVTPAQTSAQADPLLATGLEETAAMVDRPDPSLMPGPAADFDASVAPDRAVDDGFFGSSMGDDEALFGMDEAADEAAAEPDFEAVAEAVPSRPNHPVRETAAVFLLAGLGAAVGYQGSIEFGFELLNAIGVGLGVGITFGWAWIRWAERKR
jgi:hypothetical protein